MGDTDEKPDRESFKDKISGTTQKIIGEIESIGGILTGDPNTAAEGEFNVEVGTVRSHLEDEEANEGADSDETGSGTKGI